MFTRNDLETAKRNVNEIVILLVFAGFVGTWAQIKLDLIKPSR